MKNNFLYIFCIVSLFQLSCSKKEDNSTKTILKKTDSAKLQTKVEKVIDKNSNKIYNSTILKIDNALVNGHKIILEKSEFDNLYKNKIDSTKTDVWECGNPFEWLDSEWMTKKYGPKSKEGDLSKFDGKITTIFGKKIEFSTNNHIVLFDFGLAENNSFTIISHNITLDKNTSLEDFKKIFPNVKSEKLENPNEIRFRFSTEKDSDDAFLFYFKDGKLEFFTLWWLLC